jgi:alkyl sulfatase BDS1-like metallo-beta-lactamase superfamily hydrolase
MMRTLARMTSALPWHDTQDYDDATRGFIARSAQRQICASDGRVVWDLDAYAFLEEQCPATAHPSLWRQGQLLIKDGLFEVAEGIYQVRGYDLSVMSLLETDTGVLVVDPLVSCETAAAALDLYRSYRGPRPVVGVMYTHSHADHFAGVMGVVEEADVSAGRVTILAPDGFMEHAVAENVLAGVAMTRRAGYMYGAALPKSPSGQIGSGLGQTTSTGRASLIAPTVHVTHTGQEVSVDGLRMIFQITPGTEAPAEMNFYLPDHRALCTAENTSHTLHNIVTLRGAQVRDARAWADYLTETIDLFGQDLDLVFASHHWPTWGRDRAVEFLSMQRDMYAYLHDQTLRLMNRGLTGPEIAEVIQMPPALEAAWHTHGYYGSVSHNVKGIYQRYLGWFDGNPANLWAHPPVQAARRYVDAMGGRDRAMAIAIEAFTQGDLRWAAEVLNHVLYTHPQDAEAKDLQARTFEQIAFGAENGTWRNFYLAGAHELRNGIFGTPIGTEGLAAALSVDQVFSAMAVRVNGPAAWDLDIEVCWVFTDLDATYVMRLHNGVLITRAVHEPPSCTTVTLTRPVLIGLATATVDLTQALGSGALQISGDPTDLQRLVAVLDPGDPDFPIVTPREEV